MFGKIPSEIGNLVNLFVLSILYNHFEGIIPSAFGKLQKMQALELSGNKLSGVIPTSIGHFSRLFYLGLGENMLEGNILPSIGTCQKLQYLNLSHNNLRGAIPLEIFNLSSLTDALAVSQNSLSGSIPKEILDPSLVPNHGEAKFEEENGQNLTPNVEKCLVSLFNIGISCSVESPKERMNMVDVTRELSKTRKTFIVVDLLELLLLPLQELDANKPKQE
ncbi:hypothetical protein JHK86_003692 [Glycine max]|nr:hypothetical protein JHK86_003692 [Glycine max]